MIIPPNIWGQNVWYIVHGISYKISNENFLKYKNEFIELIKLLFTNLPCPDCSKDATDKLNKTNFDNILSKDDMIKYLFDFHNHVNKKNTNIPQLMSENFRSKQAYPKIKYYLNIFLKII